MRVIALLATYNEARFITACLENFVRQGVEVYLIDNESTDATVEKAKAYLEKGLVGLESLPRQGEFDLNTQLRRKETLAQSLETDWFIHADADEIRLPPDGYATLLEALTEADRQGYNAANFMEFAFIPVAESPNHDHPNFQTSMHWYYPFLPFANHRLNAWKPQPGPVNLTESGGHQVQFPGLKLFPQQFKLKHYLGLSKEHLIEKYVERRFPPQEVAQGWHGWRARLRPEQIILPSQNELSLYTSDEALDASRPRQQHYWG